MNTMLDTIIPKSDQLNADDLIGGKTITIAITGIDIKMDEQPVSIHFEGDGGKPYRPGKSMRRVLVNVWGPDANVYVGRRLTLYRDDGVKFGGMEVGGIRISHMSHLDKPMTMALTATKAQRRPFTVKPLAEKAQPAAPPGNETFIERASRETQETASDPKLWIETVVRLTTEAATASDLNTIRNWGPLKNAEATAPIKIRTQIREAFEAGLKRLATPEVENDPTLVDQESDGWPGPDTKAAA